MLLGADRVAMNGGGWKNPYITDGLIAMWDSEWNVGGGEHDASATTWKDLVGNCDLIKTGSDNFSDNYITPTSTTFESEQKMNITNGGISFAIVFELGSPSNGGDCFSFIKDSDNYEQIGLNWSDSVLWYTAITNGVESGARGQYGSFTSGAKVSCVVTFRGGNSSIRGRIFENAAYDGFIYFGHSDDYYINLSPFSIKLFGGGGWSYRKVFSVRLYNKNDFTQDEIDEMFTVDKARFGLT